MRKRVEIIAVPGALRHNKAPGIGLFGLPISGVPDTLPSIRRKEPMLMYTAEFLLNHAVRAYPPLILHLHGGSDVEHQAPSTPVRFP